MSLPTPFLQHCTSNREKFGKPANCSLSWDPSSKGKRETACNEACNESHVFMLCYFILHLCNYCDRFEFQICYFAVDILVY